MHQDPAPPLDDDAASPRFIETVPKHGYRFIAPVERVESGRRPVEPRSAGAKRSCSAPPARSAAESPASRRADLRLRRRIAAASAGHGCDLGLLVLLCLTILVALLGGAGVGFGIAAAGLARGRYWLVAGGAIGGLVIGAAVKLLGLDAFNLLIGRSPGDITGPFEGVILGAASASARACEPYRIAQEGAGLAALAGGAGGLVIPLLGGRMMGGSLDLLARQFPASRLRLDHIGALFGERGLGPVSQAVTGALEGALFAGCVVGAMILARRSMRVTAAA